MLLSYSLSLPRILYLRTSVDKDHLNIAELSRVVISGISKCHISICKCSTARRSNHTSTQHKASRLSRPLDLSAYGGAGSRVWPYE